MFSSGLVSLFALVLTTEQEQPSDRTHK